MPDYLLDECGILDINAANMVLGIFSTMFGDTDDDILFEEESLPIHRQYTLQLCSLNNDIVSLIKVQKFIFCISDEPVTITHPVYIICVSK